MNSIVHIIDNKVHLKFVEKVDLLISVCTIIRLIQDKMTLTQFPPVKLTLFLKENIYEKH